MSINYDEYLRDHRMYVNRAGIWLFSNFPEIQEKYDMNSHREFFVMGDPFPNHDESKYSEEEYEPYDLYFYGNKSSKVVKDFNYAWLHHIHHNPHHWQYWVLQHDDEPEEVLEMPYEYVIEMICDWWSFSWKSGKLTEIFDWYEKHKNMKLHPKTRKLVEDILNDIKWKLDQKESRV